LATKTAAKKSSTVPKKTPDKKPEPIPEVKDQEGDEEPNEIERYKMFKEFMEHQRTAAAEARKALGGLVPKSFREHGKSSYEEFVEGYRTLFNSTIDSIVGRIESVKLGNGEDDQASKN
jgi:hypothetical protein